MRKQAEGDTMNEELLNIRAGRIPIMMVVSDCEDGTMTRFTRDALGNRRRTHFAKAGEEYERPVEFSASVIHAFRTHPEGEFSTTGPAPIPGGSDPGGPAVAMRAA